MGTQGSKPPPEAQILILGLDGSGKSTLLYRLKYNEGVVTSPTVGFNVEMLETREKGCTLTLWDVGGQSQMRLYWKHYYRDVSGLVYVVDSRDQKRLPEAKRELERILEDEELEGKPLVVLANKQDLPGAGSAEDVSESLDLKRICGNRNWLVQPSSGRTGEGLENCFRKMIHLLKSSVVNRGYRNRGFSLKERQTRTSVSSVKSVT